MALIPKSFQKKIQEERHLINAKEEKYAEITESLTPAYVPPKITLVLNHICYICVDRACKKNKPQT